jgi:chaperonin GroEL
LFGRADEGAHPRRRAKAAIGKLSDQNADIQSGINIVLRTLAAPIRAENAGVEGSIVVGKVLENKSQTFGFDAQTEQYVDMLSAGIVDPAKVVRVALQDATSIAGLMITTEAMVAEAPKKKEGPPCQAAVWAAWTTDQLRCPPQGRHRAAPEPTLARRRQTRV